MKKKINKRIEIIWDKFLQSITAAFSWIFGDSSMTMKARKSQVQSQPSSKRWSARLALGHETILLRLLSVRQTVCRTVSFFPPSQTFIILHTELTGERGMLPCPNFMQISSSTMHIARESQQKAPTFFTGLLWWPKPAPHISNQSEKVKVLFMHAIANKWMTLLDD